MQTICTSLQTDNHTNTLSLDFYRPDALPDAKPTKIVASKKQARSFTVQHSRTNKAVIDRRLRPGAATWGVTLSTRYFLVALLRRDNNCKHDVMNIQHTRCGPVGPGCKK